MKDSANRYLQYLRHLQWAEAAHCLHEADIQADLAASLSHLRHGQIAAKASHRLENRLFRRLVAKALVGEPAPEMPAYDPVLSIPMAQIIGTERMLCRPLDTFTGHGFFQGTTGSGKTTAQVTLADSFVVRQIGAIMFARKEAGRLLLRYPDAILLRPQQLSVNFTKAIGDPRLFFAEWVPIIARGIGVRSDYVPKFLDTVVRAESFEKAKGRKLSLTKLEKVFRGLGRRGDRRCDTIASALATFNLFLQDTARIEESPQWENQFSVIILDREGAPPAYRACLDGMMQHRFQAQAAQEGYTHHLRRVIFYDEAGLEFGREFEAQQAGAGFVSPAKRGISQMRSYGVAIIYSGQSYGLMSQDIKDNTNTLCAFRTISTEDIREVGFRMNLTESQRQRLPTFPPGRAFVAAPDLPAAVEVQFAFADLGPYPAEDQIAARMAPVLQQLRQKTGFTPEDVLEPLDVDELLGEDAPQPGPTQAPAGAEALAGTLLEDHWAFLRDVAQHKDSGIAARLHRLGFGGSKGQRIREELIALGLLEAIEVRKSAVGAATKLLRLTQLAQTMPGL